MSSPSPDQRDYAALLIAKATADRHAAHVLAEADVADELIGSMPNRAWRKRSRRYSCSPARHFRASTTERLLALASEAGSPPPASVAEAGWLTPWGVQFRYDEAIELLDQDAALAVCDAALGWAVEAFDR